MKSFEKSLIDVDVEDTGHELRLSASYRNKQDICAASKIPRSSSDRELGRSVQLLRKAVIEMEQADVI